MPRRATQPIGPTIDLTLTVPVNVLPALHDVTRLAVRESQLEPETTYYAALALRFAMRAALEGVKDVPPET